jgi:hypothetical protein
MKKCSYCGREYTDDAVVCTVDQNPLTAGVAEDDNVANSRQPAKPTTPCPACGALDDYKPAVELRGSFSLLVFLAGGLLAVFFHNAGRPKRVQCNKCGALFNIRTPLTNVSSVIFWLLVAPTIIVLLILLVALLYSFFAR